MQTGKRKHAKNKTSQGINILNEFNAMRKMTEITSQESKRIHTPLRAHNRRPAYLVGNISVLIHSCPWEAGQLPHHSLTLLHLWMVSGCQIFLHSLPALGSTSAGAGMPCHSQTFGLGENAEERHHPLCTWDLHSGSTQTRPCIATWNCLHLMQISNGVYRCPVSVNQFMFKQESFPRRTTRDGPTGDWGVWAPPRATEQIYRRVHYSHCWWSLWSVAIIIIIQDFL